MERKFFPYVWGAVFIAFIFAVLFFISPEPNITGRVSFDVALKYNPGEKILGELKFNIKEGELVPRDSVVFIDYMGQSKSFLLSELVRDKPIEGNFYAEGTSLTGRGLGYGVKGRNIAYPSIDFILKISDSDALSSSKNSQSKSGAPVGSSGSGGGSSPSPGLSPAEAEPSAPSAESESSPASSDDAPSPGLTGAFVNENSYEIKGTVSYESPFKYALKSGQTAQLVEGSVSLNGKPLPDSSISAYVKGAKAIVSTSYFVNEEQFGKYFLGDYALTLTIDVDSLNLYAKEGVIKIRLVYGGATIASHSQIVSVASPADKTINLLREIPTIRISPDGEAVLNLSQYFEGAESYAIELPNIATAISNHEIVFKPESGFKGARRVRVIAYAGENKLESNEFVILVSSGAVDIKTIKDRIEVGKLVHWTKNVKFDSPDALVIDIPDEASDISVTKLAEASSESGSASVGSGLLTGQVSIELDINKRAGFVRWVKRIVNRFTGRITENTFEDISVDSALNDVTLLPDSSGYNIEYYTPSPEAFEEETEQGKRVTISGPDNIIYEDVIASVSLDESRGIRDASRIRLYWLTAEPVISEELKEVDEVLEQEVVEELSVEEAVLNPVASSSESAASATSEPQQLRNVAVPFDAYDLDGDSVLDLIEWVVPHLSNQTYEIILVIRAEHLDENRTFISDIYESVKSLDGNWSETILSGHHVRATFEINLTSDRDITIYPRTSAGTPQIEVYEANGNEILARFDNLVDNSYNKVYLTNLTHSQDTFDLRVLDGDVQFEHIIDPAVDVTPPNIDFVSPTPADASTQLSNAIYVNVSSSDSSQHYTFADFDRSLLLWMRMDEVNASGDPTDLSSWSNNGSKKGGAVQNTSGYFNSSFSFDGDADFFEGNYINGDYIDITPLPDFNASGNYTYAAWIYPIQSVRQGIISQARCQTGGSGINLYLNASNTFYISKCSVSSEDIVVSSSETVSLSQWSFVTATYSGGNVTVYINGVSNGNGAATFTSGNELENIGRAASTSTYYFNGSIDEVLIFNRTLAQAEISALYNASANKYYNNFTNLASGAHTFTGYAVDTRGNKNQTDQHTVTIDTTAPVVNLQAPANGSTVTTASWSFNATFTDNNALANATFYLWNSTLTLINTTTNSLSGT